ncbi:hypothetical protein [Pseudomonas aeruginosa]|uniref:hypothetical protein n=1 Tax=Pseudomonas aeruginosa TaxID=287 RepID=UPI003D298451
MQNGGSGYFRTRVVSSYLDGGTLQRVEQAPEFAYPTYLVYSRERLSPTCAMRSSCCAKWSARTATGRSAGTT